MGFVGDMLGLGGDDPGEKAAQASREAGKSSAEGQIKAAEIAAGYQREALGYLKEREELPQQFREGALSRLAGAYGVEGGTGSEFSQQETIDKALKSPLYGAIMGGQEAGEEAILRNASATGGLRSGDVQSNLYDYNVQLQNQALLQSYNEQIGLYDKKMQGLQGLGGLPSMAPAIAQQTGQIGQTLGGGQAGASQSLAQSQIAAAQALQTGGQQQAGNVMGMGQLGLQAYGMFSDRRLKTNIKKIGFLKGFNLYSWDWNVVAQKMGLSGGTYGCMADEVYTERPDAVSIKDLFMFVDYNKIGILGV